MIFGNTRTYKKPVDKEKKLALQKMMVGHYIERIPENCSKKVIYLMQGDGIWERRVNKLGVFDSRVAKANVPGLDCTLEDSFTLDVPKIPINLLGTTVAFFRRIYRKHSSEVFLQFYYDEEGQKYILHCPQQMVSGASVNYKNDPKYDSKILVFEVHSHGNMGASFSSIDDADEKSDRFYGVIGNITNFFPDIMLRLVLGGREYEIEVDDLFDTDEELYHAETFPVDWVDKIKKKKVSKRKRPKKNEKFDSNGVFEESDEGFESISLFNEEDGELDDYYADHSFCWEYNNSSLDDDGCYIDGPDDYHTNDPNDYSYYIKEDDRLWFVENGKKKYYVERGEIIFPDDDRKRTFPEDY